MPAPLPRVLLLPGVGLDDREWEGVRARLECPSEVVLLPSQGLPASRGDDLRVTAQADRVLRALPLRWPGEEPLLLVGHSAGCPVAVEVAARSARVAGLVLVGPVTDPAARGWPRMAWRWLRTAAAERLGELRTLAPQYARTGVLSVLTGMDRMRGHSLEQALAGVTVPVVLVRGEDDRIAPLDWLTRLASAPGRSVRVVRGAGHMVPLTHPEAVAEAVREVRDAVDMTRPGR